MLQELGPAVVMADTMAAIAYRVGWDRLPAPAAMGAFRLAPKADSAPRRTVDFQEPLVGRQKAGCLEPMAGYRVAPRVEALEALNLAVPDFETVAG